MNQPSTVPPMPYDVPRHRSRVVIADIIHRTGAAHYYAIRYDRKNEAEIVTVTVRINKCNSEPESINHKILTCRFLYIKIQNQGNG